MTKYEFLGELDKLLSGLPTEEREEAMQYYQEYFEDGGKEQEQAIIEELESPQKVAAKILGTESEQTEYGNRSESKSGHSLSNPEEGKRSSNEKTSKFDNKMIAIIIIAVLFFPVIVPVLSSVFGILIGFVSALFGITIAFWAAGIGLCAGGVACVAACFVKLVGLHLWDGLLALGTGCIILPIGIWLCLIGKDIMFKLFPEIWKLLQRFWTWGVAQIKKLA